MIQGSKSGMGNFDSNGGQKKPQLFLQQGRLVVCVYERDQLKHTYRYKVKDALRFLIRGPCRLNQRTTTGNKHVIQLLSLQATHIWYNIKLEVNTIIAI